MSAISLKGWVDVGSGYERRGFRVWTLSGGISARPWRIKRPDGTDAKDRRGSARRFASLSAAIHQANVLIALAAMKPATSKPEKTKRKKPHQWALNPWVPMSDPVDVKHLGKLAEECNELGSATARCLIQGIDEAEPVTGKINRQWLQDECADVLANVELVIVRFGLDPVAIATRKQRKQAHLSAWHAMAGGGK